MESVSHANQRPSARRRELELFIFFPVFTGPPVTSNVRAVDRSHFAPVGRQGMYNIYSCIALQAF